jgi:DNA/RNA non-specific endonuclease
VSSSGSSTGSGGPPSSGSDSPASELLNDWGSGDDGVPVGPADAATEALAAAQDAEILTPIDQGAAQLLSTATDQGLSNPYQGWDGIAGAAGGDPYSGAPAMSLNFELTADDVSQDGGGGGGGGAGGGGGGGISNVAADTGGTTYAGQWSEDGVMYNWYADINGTLNGFPVDATPAGPAPGGTPPTGGTGTSTGAVPSAAPPAAAAPAPVAPVPPSPPSVPVAPSVPAAPPVPAPPPVGAAGDPALGPSGPDPAPPPTGADTPTTPPGVPPPVPPDPQSPSWLERTWADRPPIPVDGLGPSSAFGQWVAHSSWTTLLQDDQALATAQLAAGAVALGAATVATGGLASGAVGGVLAGGGATALETTILTSAAGSVASGAVFRGGVTVLEAQYDPNLGARDVLGSAFDPNAMATDALVGGAFAAGGYGVARGVQSLGGGRAVLAGVRQQVSALWADEEGAVKFGSGPPETPAVGGGPARPAVQGPARAFTTSTDSLGGTHPLQYAPPDPAAVADGSQLYYVDPAGRPIGSEGWVYPKTVGQGRAAGSAAAQRAVTGGTPGLHGAHLFADRLGGAGIAPNLVPYSAEANLSAMKTVENAIAESESSGLEPYIQVVADYADNGRIPSSVTYRVWTAASGDMQLTRQVTVNFDNTIVNVH